MADRLDVAGRLDEGRAAIEHTQAYVRACETIGYQHPDLTSRPSQVRDWFDSEDGLNLVVLDGDCARLRAAGAAAAESLRIQQSQIGELTAAWTGAGSDAAVAFLQHHCDVATMVAAEIRAAAQRCESLRDNLWYLLDSKVGTAVAIDDRSRPQRPSWLAAAAAVTAGTGERSGAEQIVRTQLMPFVDNDIGHDWLDAMRSSQVAFGAAYDMVNQRMAGAPAVPFDYPGDLGPGFQPAAPSAPPPMIPAATPSVPFSPGAPAASSAPAATAPAAAVLPDVASEPPPAPAAAAPPAPAVADPGSALGDTAGMPMGGGGLGDPGAGSGGLGGLSGLADRIVEALSGLLGSAADGLGDVTAEDDPLGDDTDDDPFHPDDHPDDEDHDDPFHPDDQDVGEQPDTKADEVKGPQVVDGAKPADAAVAPPLPADEPAPTPAAAPAVTPAPAAAPGPPSDGSTPCEIAADQVPQAGQ